MCVCVTDGRVWREPGPGGPRHTHTCASKRSKCTAICLRSQCIRTKHICANKLGLTSTVARRRCPPRKQTTSLRSPHARTQTHAGAHYYAHTILYRARRDAYDGDDGDDDGRRWRVGRCLKCQIIPRVQTKVTDPIPLRFVRSLDAPRSLRRCHLHANSRATRATRPARTHTHTHTTHAHTYTHGLFKCTPYRAQLNVCQRVVFKQKSKPTLAST